MSSLSYFLLVSVKILGSKIGKLQKDSKYIQTFSRHRCNTLLVLWNKDKENQKLVGPILITWWYLNNWVHALWTRSAIANLTCHYIDWEIIIRYLPSDDNPRDAWYSVAAQGDGSRCDCVVDLLHVSFHFPLSFRLTSALMCIVGWRVK